MHQPEEQSLRQPAGDTAHELLGEDDGVVGAAGDFSREVGEVLRDCGAPVDFCVVDLLVSDFFMDDDAAPARGGRGEGGAVVESSLQRVAVFPIAPSVATLARKCRSLC